MNIPGKCVMISRLKETLYFIFFVFLLSLRKFFNVVMISSCKQDLAAIRPRNMLQPMPGTNEMLENLNLISSKYQIFSISHDVCFSCAWDSSFGKNDDGQGLFVGWFELH